MNRNLLNILIICALVVVLSGCAASVPHVSQEIPPGHTVSEFSDDEIVSRTADPWESFNRSMYRFNYEADRFLVLPLVNAYETAIPGFVRAGVSNFFANIHEIPTFFNCILQAKGKKSLVTLGRFLANSTIGIGGLFDPATAFGMRREHEDFDRTLETWGVGTGPYMVLPILGPNTARSTGGLAVDGGGQWAIINATDPFGGTGARTEIETGTMALEAVDLRYRETFRYYDSDYPFEYYIVRYLISQERDLKILK